MNLIEGFVKDEIFIDFGADVLYRSDQCNVSFPCRFPTVTFTTKPGTAGSVRRVKKETAAAAG